MRAYLVDEYAAHHKSAPDGGRLSLAEWEDWCPRTIPHQNNGSDCGVFTLKFADFLSHDPHTSQLLSPHSSSLSPHSPPLRFAASNMDYFRHRIALEIKLQRVL